MRTEGDGCADHGIAGVQRADAAVHRIRRMQACHAEVVHAAKQGPVNHAAIRSGTRMNAEILANQ